MTTLAFRRAGKEAAVGAEQTEPLSLESVANVREALAVALTSAYLLRRRLSDAGVVDEYFEKHLLRIEESVGRAELALETKAI